MNSIKSKSTDFWRLHTLDQPVKAIGGVAVVPGKTGAKMYVAWEWTGNAEEGFFAITSKDVFSQDSRDIEAVINEVANYGQDVTHREDARALFPYLFN